jgi:hypothetical protein
MELNSVGLSEWSDTFKTTVLKINTKKNTKMHSTSCKSIFPFSRTIQFHLYTQHLSNKSTLIIRFCVYYTVAVNQSDMFQSLVGATIRHTV